jgi:hypothetical protein
MRPVPSGSVLAGFAAARAKPILNPAQGIQSGAASDHRRAPRAARQFQPGDLIEWKSRQHVGAGAHEDRVGGQTFHDADKRFDAKLGHGDTNAVADPSAVAPARPSRGRGRARAARALGSGGAWNRPLGLIRSSSSCVIQPLRGLHSLYPALRRGRRHVLAQACRLGAEGDIVSKCRTAPYRAGSRSDDWRKTRTGLPSTSRLWSI